MNTLNRKKAKGILFWAGAVFTLLLASFGTYFLFDALHINYTLAFLIRIVLIGALGYFFGYWLGKNK